MTVTGAVIVTIAAEAPFTLSQSKRKKKFAFLSKLSHFYFPVAVLFYY
jgi:hypothetical protein